WPVNMMDSPSWKDAGCFRSYGLSVVVGILSLPRLVLLFSGKDIRPPAKLGGSSASQPRERLRHRTNCRGSKKITPTQSIDGNGGGRGDGQQAIRSQQSVRPRFVQNQLCESGYSVHDLDGRRARGRQAAWPAGHGDRNGRVVAEDDVAILIFDGDLDRPQ